MGVQGLSGWLLSLSPFSVGGLEGGVRAMMDNVHPANGLRLKGCFKTMGKFLRVRGRCGYFFFVTS